MSTSDCCRSYCVSFGNDGSKGRHCDHYQAIGGKKKKDKVSNDTHLIDFLLWFGCAARNSNFELTNIQYSHKHKFKIHAQIESSLPSESIEFNKLMLPFWQFCPNPF